VYLANYIEGNGTAAWQAQMVARGWALDVDDCYGNQSEQVCVQFQEEKGLAVDGIVGPATWAAAWTAPVT
jgi:murein L,D-transpeptidase YcbB/YkuD